MSAPTVPATRSTAPTINFGLVLLLVIYTLNYLDRQVANIVAEPIKAELHLSDTQLGLLTGLAFVVFYTLLGIPLARLADSERTNRPVLIAICLAAWSVMTAACGLATNFTQLILARIGVGVGEAGCSPAAHSLISDTVPREQRASAMAFYSMGIPFGKLFGLLIGGVVANALGWRMSFLVVGIPGAVLALGTWKMLPEPRIARNANPATAARNNGASTMASLGKLLPIRTFWITCMAAAFMTFLSYGQTSFLGSFLIRVHHVNVGQAGIMLGLALGGAGAVGTYYGGKVTDHYAAKDRRAYVIVPAIASLVGLVLFVLAVLAGNLWLALGTLAVATALTSVWYGPTFALFQNLVQPPQRAMAAAVSLLLMNLIGLGLGPLTFGMLSDAFSKSGLGPAEGLRYALVAGSFTSLIAIVLYVVAAKTIKADLAESSASA